MVGGDVLLHGPRRKSLGESGGSTPPQNQNTSGTSASRANQETSSLPVNMPGSTTAESPSARRSAEETRAVASSSLIVAGSVCCVWISGSRSAPDAMASARTIRSTLFSTFSRASSFG